MLSEKAILRRVGRRAKRIWRACAGEKDGLIPRRTIARYLPADPVIVEAGAASGEDAAASAVFWPGGRVFAFEPVPQLFEQLVGLTKGLTNVKCVAKGLFDHCGRVPMHLSNNGFGSSSVLKPTGHLDFHPEVGFDDTMEIEVTTLDVWAVEEAIDKVDFLWLDMQGAELAAMRHGESIIQHASAIHAEVSLRPTYHGAPLYPEVKAWLAARGFVVAVESLPHPDMGNVLFVNSTNLSRSRSSRRAVR